MAKIIQKGVRVDISMLYLIRGFYAELRSNIFLITCFLFFLMKEASYFPIVFKIGITYTDNTCVSNGISNKDVDNSKLCLLRAMSFSIRALSLSSQYKSEEYT